MSTTCVICGAFINGSDLACSDRCFKEFETRREIALSKIRAIDALKKKKRTKTIGQIDSDIIRALSRVILEKNIPMYASGVELDELICKVDPTLMDMNRCFRRSKITRTIDQIHYTKRSHSTGGRTTFILDGDRDVVRGDLEQKSRAGMS
jgi:hypothetical protein